MTAADESLEDLIAEALQDSMDVDWNSHVGARHVLRALRPLLLPFAKIGAAYNRPPRHPAFALADDDSARPGPDGLTVGDFRRLAELAEGEPS